MLGCHDETDFPNVLESWSDLLHEEDKAHVMEEFFGAITDYTGKKSYSVEFRLLTRSRGWRWFQAAGKLSRREDGTPVTYVGIFVDITRQKLADGALEAQRKLLEDALEQAQQAKRARSIFLSNMSHDLRTPMNAITGFTTLASLSIDDKAQMTDYLDKIMSSASDLQSLIANLLDMSFVESGVPSANEALCSLPDLLRDLEDSARAEAQARQLHLAVECGGLTHEDVICDPQQLSQALTNITGNALKFTPPGGQIIVRLTEARGAPAGYGFYVFKIRDTGVGMDKEALSRIFEPFEREQPVSPGKTQGMGLGMALTQNIVERMGGTISVDSEEGKGTEVTITIQFRLAGKDEKKS